MFASRLKQLRTEKGLTQGELAKQFGLKPSIVGMYENNHRMPEIRTLSLMADFFNVTTDYLLDRTNLRERFEPNKLKALRENRSLEDYSVKLGITKNLLERFEEGKEIPSKGILDYIAEVENIDSNYFFTESNEITVEQKTFEGLSNNNTLSDEIKEWLQTPDCKEYIEFIYKVFKQGITKDILKKAEINIKIV